VGSLGGQTRRIVVGVDCSPQSEQLLRWACKQADLTGSTLVAVTSWRVELPGLDPASADLDVEARTRRLLAETIARALGPERADGVTLHPCASRPADALLTQARRADLLIVGPRGPHPLKHLALGSVTEHVVSQATCPVAIVHTDDHRGAEISHRRIVVGVDGSPCARRALHWAIRQAELTGSTVDAVLAWEWEPLYGVYPYGPPDETWAHNAEQLVRREVAELAPGAASIVHGRAVRGHPAQVLIDASDDSDLVVVGNRGVGNAVTRMLGSVSQKVARHANVPVVVVHDHDQEAEG
jgi:nucleotide-binding universal stress UspA family protein